jgi:biopolymer transport protein ExbD
MLTSSFAHQQRLSLASPVISRLAEPAPPQRVGLTINADLQRWGELLSLSDQALVHSFDLNKSLLISASEQAQVQTIVSVLIHLDKVGFTQVSIGPL